MNMNYQSLLKTAQQIANLAGAEAIADSDQDQRLYIDQSVVIIVNQDEEIEVWIRVPHSKVLFEGNPVHCVLKGWMNTVPDVYRPDLLLPDQTSWVDHLTKILEQLQPQPEPQPLVTILHQQLGTPPDEIQRYLVQLSQLNAMGLAIAGWLISVLTLFLPPVHFCDHDTTSKA